MNTPPAMPSLPPQLPPRRSSGKGTLLKIVAGIVIGIAVLLFAAQFIEGFKKGFNEAKQRREALRDVEQGMQASQNKMRDAFNEESGFSPEKAAEAAEMMKEQLDKASKNLSGDDALVVQASRDYVIRFQEKAATYNALLKEIEIEKLLDLRNVDLAGLEQRRKATERMLAANAELSESIRNAEKDFEAELEKKGVGPQTRREALKGFRGSARSQHEILLKIRATDQQVGEAAIELFDLMSRDWGKWEYDKKDSLVRFESDSSIATYNQIMERIQKASQEQFEAQRELTQAK